MKVAIVGTGGVANRHLGVLAPMADVEVVAHVSPTRGRARSQACRWGGRAHTSVEQMLDRERPDAVWLCVTPDRHGVPEVAMIERGVPFFVEKPVANDFPTAQGIAERLAATNLVVGVGYKYRALDTLPRVRQLLRERPAQMVLAAWHDATPSPSWWRDAARSGGQIVEQATHLVDLARLLVGEAEVASALSARQPRAAYPDATVENVSLALLRFAGGVPGVLSTTPLLEGRQAIHLQLVCEGRVLTITDSLLRVETGQSTEETPVTVDPFDVEDRAFLAAVRQGDRSQVLCAYADALKTHALCCAIASWST
jgi:myo-inositol 2-dehydrogenase / D-chiro-inositol 1-dehydrogenase